MIGTILGATAIIWLCIKSEAYRELARGVRDGLEEVSDE